MAGGATGASDRNPHAPTRGSWRVRVLLMALLFVLAGCSSPPEPPAPMPAGPDFDGEGAYAYVEGLVTEDGAPRFRVPGTAGHASAADWLEQTMAMPGWAVTRDAFTGADYAALDRPSTSSWNDRCPEDDRDELDDLRFWNVWATWGPAEPADAMVWLGAHWESKEEASQDQDTPDAPVLGANDGASGVGVLLQLMEHMSAGDVEVPFGVGVVFFDGEDGFEDCHPLAGSYVFTDRMAPGLVDRFLLLDMVGDPDARFVRESNSLASDQDLVDLLWQHGSTYAPEAFTDRERAVTDDHLPFIEAGVRAVDIIDAGRPSFFPPYWHTTDDTMENISPDMLGAVGNTLWATLTDPTFAEAL